MNTNSCKISIITVVYNCVENIKKSIDNTLSQTYPNIELIIVDGNSTDGTVDIIKQYEGKLKYISEKDKGIYDAMNKGIKMASGEWVIMHNCGDYFLKETSIEDVFKQIPNHNEYTFIACNLLVYNGIGTKEIEPKYIHTNNVFKGMPLHHPATFIKRDWHINHLYDLSFRNSADYNFFAISLLENRKFLHIGIPIVLFDASEGTTTIHYDRTILDNIKILSSLGAEKHYIKNLKVLLFKTRIIKFLKSIPVVNSILNYRRKHKLKNCGWTIIDKETLLNNLP